MLTLIAAAGLQAGAGGPVHAGSPAQALEDADDGSGNFDLPGIGAMAGAGRVEWCMSCQLSPSESRAGGHKLVAQSWRRVVNGRITRSAPCPTAPAARCCTMGRLSRPPARPTEAASASAHNSTACLPDQDGHDARTRAPHAG
jgi:hypothetical protein